MKSYSELRADLMRLADEENKTRLALIEIQKMKAISIAELVSAAEKLIPRAYDERNADGELLKPYQPDTNVQAVEEFVHPYKRACSMCGKPGHRAPTCPEAHVKQEEKKREVEVRDGRKRRTCSICRQPGHWAKNCPNGG